MAVEHSLPVFRMAMEILQDGGGAFSTGIQDGGEDRRWRRCELTFSTGIQDGGGAFSTPET